VVWEDGFVVIAEDDSFVTTLDGEELREMRGALGNSDLSACAIEFRVHSVELASGIVYSLLRSFDAMFINDGGLIGVGREVADAIRRFPDWKWYEASALPSVS
jgi:hypothetical protein